MLLCVARCLGHREVNGERIPYFFQSVHNRKFFFLKMGLAEVLGGDGQEAARNRRTNLAIRRSFTTCSQFRHGPIPCSFTCFGIIPTVATYKSLRSKHSARRILGDDCGIPSVFLGPLRLLLYQHL